MDMLWVYTAGMMAYLREHWQVAEGDNKAMFLALLEAMDSRNKKRASRLLDAWMREPENFAKILAECVEAGKMIGRNETKQ